MPHLHKRHSSGHGVLGLGLAGREELTVSGTKYHHVEEALVGDVVEDQEKDFLCTGQ